jgi:hypothetical protein
MAMLNLTAKSQKALKSLASIDDAALQELSGLLAQHLQELSEPSDALALSLNFKKLPHDQAFELLNFFAPFCMVRLSESTDYKELVDAVLNNLSSADNDDPLTIPQRRQLKGQLTKILSNPMLALKSKAIRLQTTHDKVFQKAEFFSDIRPVFSVNGKPSIDAAVTVQTLRLDFYEEGEVKTFSCAMDSKDIRLLKGALERAEKKEKALFSMLDRAGISTFKVE